MEQQQTFWRPTIVMRAFRFGIQQSKQINALDQFNIPALISHTFDILHENLSRRHIATIQANIIRVDVEACVVCI